MDFLFLQSAGKTIQGKGVRLEASQEAWRSELPVILDSSVLAGAHQ